MTNPSHPRLERLLGAMSAGTAIAALSIGCLVLAGWLFDVAVFKSLHPDLVSMKAITAAAFVLTGSSLWLSQAKRTHLPIARYGAWAGSAVIAALGLLTLAEYALGWNLGIDQLLFTEPTGTVLTVHPGRMAPNTAFNFLLLGLSLLLLDVRTRGGHRPAQYLIGLGGFIALAALVGYLYGASVLYSPIRSATPMSVPAVLAGILAFAGLWLARPAPELLALLAGENAGSRTARHFLLPVLLLPVLLDVVLLAGQRAGLYGEHLAAAVHAVSMTAIFLWLVLAAAALVNRAETELAALRRAPSGLPSAISPPPEGSIPSDRYAPGTHGRRWLRYIVAIVIVAAATLVRLGFLQMLGSRATYVTLYPAVMLAALYGGLPAGLLATVFSGILADYFWLEPVGFGISDPADWLSLAIFLAGGTMISGIAEAMHRARARAHATETEATLAVARKQDLEALRQQREWLRVTLSSIGDAVLATDTAGLITFLNPVAETLTGWAENEALGQRIQNVFQVINEETRVPGEDIVARVLREKRVVALANHTALVTRDGREVPIEDSAAPIKDSAGTVSGVVLVFHDVTGKRRAQAAMRETQKERERLLLQHQAILDSLYEGVSLSDAEGNVLLMNRAALALYQLEPTGESRPLSYFAETIECFDLQGRLLPLTEWPRARVLRGETLSECEVRVRRKDTGYWFIASFNGTPIRGKSGEIQLGVLTARDISARKRAEDAVQQLNAELRQRVAELQAAHEEVQASRRAALSLAEDTLEARKEAERVNADLQQANQSLGASRRAALNLMDDAVRARNQAEQASAELQMLNRTLKAHAKSDQALLRAQGEAEFLNAVCRVVVEDCGHTMVWVGFAENDEGKTVRPAAQAGFEAGYLETLKITWADTERGRGPTGTAIRTGQPSKCRNMQTDPRFAPWRAEAIKRGYASSLVLPLLAEGRAFGALTIYSRQPDGFSDDEVTLLTELAGDLAYGISALRLRAAKTQAEEALRQSQERYRGLVELSPEALFVNRNDRIVLVNPAALQLFGAYSAEQLLGKSPFNVFHPDCHALMRERISKVLAGQRVPLLEEKIVRLDGAVVDVEVVAAPVTDQGEPAIQVLLRDITERKRAKAALQRTAEELERSNRDLEQFAYVASHDLQEPLRAVGGYMKLLERRLSGGLDARSREFIAGAFEGAVRMERLIRDLLAFSRVGTRGGKFLATDLEVVLGEALANLQASLESSHASVTHEPLPRVAVDATQLMQVFQNLIGNALKFHGEAPPSIHVGAQRQDERWVFSVRDNGIGIEPQYFEKIFQIFQRLHTRKDYSGTGIGLAICKKIVERHGGTIWVESQSGQGSTFYFSLPEPASR